MSDLTIVRRRMAQGGFTLVEVLVSLSLIVVVALIAMGAITPWIGFKQKLDTERRLIDIRQGMTAMYNNQGMRIEDQDNGTFAQFVNSVPAAGTDGLLRCAPQVNAFQSNSDVFSEFPQQLANDGYMNPWCIFVSPAIREVRDNVPLWYRNVAVISTGPNGGLDAGTTLAASGLLTVAGDDTGITVSGREIQGAKLTETLRRLNRVAQAYETYFTARFLASGDRDVTTYYFTSGVPGRAWEPVTTVLANVGIAGIDASTPWEAYNGYSNLLEVCNVAGCQTPGGTPIRASAGVLPYTALLRARVPNPWRYGNPEYATQIVVGNY